MELAVVATGCDPLVPALAEHAPGWSATQFASCEALLTAAKGPHGWRLALLPAGDVRAIARLRALDSTLPIVAVCETGDVGLAAEVTRHGATDLLVLGSRVPERVATLFAKLRPVFALREENRRLRAEGGARWALVGRSPEMERLRATIELVARIPRPVLILGERGTGKELVARAIHASSRRGPLVAVNCAAFPDSLLESELFGHEKGAFTGADRRVPGKFEQADGGTLFLDEIGAMSLPFQQKILRVVEYGELTRVGGGAPVQTNTRVVAASNVDLLERVAEGRFLPDLYDRLSFEVIRVPPLRDRGDDIALLAEWFLESFQAEVASLPPRRLSVDALEALQRWSFPGNIRELKHVVERAAHHPGGLEITAEDLGLGGQAPPAGRGFEVQVDAFKRGLLQGALDRCGGNQAAAARMLDLTYDQLRWYRKQLLDG